MRNLRVLEIARPALLMIAACDPEREWYSQSHDREYGGDSGGDGRRVQLPTHIHETDTASATADVRCWVKQTESGRRPMSPFDPKRPYGGLRASLPYARWGISVNGWRRKASRG
jgi:hypothetical protein